MATPTASRSGSRSLTSRPRSSASCVPAALGRTFSAADVGAGRLAVISDSLWRTRFGAARDAVGRTVRLNGEPFTVVGVMPPGFAYPEPEMAVWRALDLREPSDPQRPQPVHRRAARPRRDPDRSTTSPASPATCSRRSPPTTPRASGRSAPNRCAPACSAACSLPGGPARRRRLGAAHRLRERRDHGAAARRRAAARARSASPWAPVVAPSPASC